MKVAKDSPETSLNWLFLDLNSYFTSVEQEVRPELRGRPIAVVPMMAETTCCLAASYEAKALGIKTGTLVRDARQICPEITFVVARHELYIRYHHRIIEAVNTCLPVTSVRSIDEMACRLMGRERPLLAAMELGRKVKQTIREQVGSTLRCSIGLATNAYLAKIATDMDKPDGLIALPLDILPSALRTLTLRDLPGVGARMEQRLNAHGLRTMDQLLSMTPAQAREAWGSVSGERVWRKLQGEDLDDDTRPETPKSIGHQHVLGPDLRTPDAAWAVAHKLLHKAAMRLRKHNLWTSRMGITIGFLPPRDKRDKYQATAFRPKAEYWAAERRFEETQTNTDLIRALRELWAERPTGQLHQTPYFLGVVLHHLVPDELHELSLFSDQEHAEEQRQLTAVMDELNLKYGLNTLTPATMLHTQQAATTRIPFSTVPELWQLQEEEEPISTETLLNPTYTLSMSRAAAIGKMSRESS